MTPVDLSFVVGRCVVLCRYLGWASAMSCCVWTQWECPVVLLFGAGAAMRCCGWTRRECPVVLLFGAGDGNVVSCVDAVGNVLAGS